MVGQIASTHHSGNRRQRTANHAARQYIVEDDGANGSQSVEQRWYCDACERPRRASGFIQDGRYSICNACASGYALARSRGRGLVVSIGQYVRDMRFGETLAYSGDEAS